MGALTAAGNALFFAALGGAAYFGYYTVRYTTPEMEQLIQERKQPQHDFPGRLVRCRPCAYFCVIVGVHVQGVPLHCDGAHPLTTQPMCAGPSIMKTSSGIS